MSGLQTWMVANALFPLQEALKRHDTVAVRRAMERSQWWDAARLEEFRVARLRALLTDAGRHVPYYRDLFAQHGVDPARITSIDDLRKVPLLTKALIRQNFERLKSANAGKVMRFNTGGSSGEPLVFLLGNERISHDVAAKWRATRWWGVDIGDPEIVVWGSPIELGAQDRMRALRDRVLRSELLPAFEMSPQKLDHFVARIRARQPRMLFGYPSSLSMIALHARARGVRLDDLGIKVAFVTAERLDDEQRRVIAETFACNVANGYGGRDAGFIAHACPAGGMHLTAEDIIVETIDQQGAPVAPGTPGEIVVTHLATRDFPFVRYRTGDVGVLDTAACSCGRGLPLLKEIQGRVTDFIVAADGTVMHGLALVYVLRELPGVEAFKIIQERLELTRVLLVAGAAFPADGEARIQAAFRRRLGADVEVKIERVSEIAPERSGKYRYVVSHVTPPARATRAPVAPAVDS